MAASVRHCAGAQPRELAELRLLIELPAMRRLADRGLSDQELALAGNLADGTVRAARSGDIFAYLRADVAFHRCLLELTGDPALAAIAQLPLLAPDRWFAAGAGEPDYFMAREAREHRELAGLLADGMVSAVDRLLRRHLSGPSANRQALCGPSASRQAAARAAGPEFIGCGRA
jgi:DNA-binding GntR family transcriptional regulator